MKYFLLYALPVNKPFQMETSKPKGNKASYSEAISYFHPYPTKPPTPNTLLPLALRSWGDVTYYLR